MPTMTATDQIAPPSAPLVSAVPPAPEPDDIPDPDVPAAIGDTPPAGPMSAQWREHEALLHGFTAQIQRWMLDYHKQMMACVEATLEPVRQVLRQDASDNEHASYALADALLKMQEQGIRVQTSPYIATVHATTPQGYGLDLQIQKTAPQELVDAVTSLVAWLEQSGFAGAQGRTP